MRIEEELKLDYSDVLFRPKRSTLKSRKDVNLLRTYRFKYSKNEWSGIPIMAANMDGVGELSIAEKLNDHQMITCLTKQHDVKKIKQNKNIKKNGGNGTEHGYGTAVFLAGGLVKKSQVHTDWPGLKRKELFDGRDLNATIDARSIYASAMSTVFDLDFKRVEKEVFFGDKLQNLSDKLFKA